MATPNLSSSRDPGSVASPESAPNEPQAGAQQQRARLLAAMVEIVADGGFARTSIGELARRAGVSQRHLLRAVRGQAECFLAPSTSRSSGSCASSAPGRKLAGRADLEFFIDALVGYAAEHPRAYEFLFHEALLAGQAASRRRDDLARWILARARESEAHRDDEADELDVPAGLILGAALRLLTMYTKRDSLPLEQLRAELRTLISSYRVPRGASRWNELRGVPGLEGSLADGREAEAVRRSAPKGRHGLSAEALRALQRERIAYGTATAIREKGYAEATVSDIVAASGVSRDVFYSEFHDKHEAFNEAAKLVFEQLLARMASAYYGSAAPWPRAGVGCGQRLRGATSKAIRCSRTSSSSGPARPSPQVDLVNEYVLAFKVFIEDGFQQRAHGKDVPPIASELLVCGVLAVVTYQIRDERLSELRGLIPAIVYTVIAPFLGRDEAEMFVEEQIAAALASR